MDKPENHGDIYSAANEPSIEPVTQTPQGEQGQEGQQQQTPAGDGAPAGDGQQQQTTPAAGQQQAPKQETDEERIARVAATVLKVTGQAGGKREQPAEKQLTEAELESLLKPVKVTPELMKQLGYENATPEQVKAFQGFANMVVQNAFAMSNLALEQRMRAAYQEFTPIAQFYQAQQAERERGAFFGKYPELKKHEKLVALAARSISPTKEDGSEKSVDSVMQEVRDAVATILKGAGVELTADSGGGDATVTTGGGSTVPKLESLAQPGKSQAGGGGGGGKPNNPDADIYS